MNAKSRERCRKEARQWRQRRREAGVSDGERCGRVRAMSPSLRRDSEYVRVNGKAMRTKRCQTNEEAKEWDRTGARRRQLPKRRRAGERGVSRGE